MGASAKKWLAAAVMVAVLAFDVVPVLAQTTTDEEAKAAYKEGSKHYSLGNFAKAAEYFKKAFEGKPDPVLLYNIAQAYRLSNDFQQALFFYKSYLRGRPDAANATEVEGRIRDMEEALAKQKEAANRLPNDQVAPGDQVRVDRPPPPKDVPAISNNAVQVGAETPVTGNDDGASVATVSESADEGRPIHKQWWFWAGIGAVVVGVVVIAVVASGGGDAATPPASHFGNVNLF